MQFSILVIAHRRAGHLQRLLDGVQRSSMKPQEVVIVYMDDPAPAPVESSLTVKTIHLRSLPGERGLPLARARNTAARNARTENLVFLDIDCIPSKECFAGMLRTLASQRALVMAEPRYLRSALPAGAPPEDSKLSELSESHHARSGLPRNVPCQLHEMFWSLAFAIKSGDFSVLEGFSEEYEGYGAEDTDFAFKARESNLPVVFIRETVFHQHHGVFKPPLNHFSQIVENAQRFRHRWGTWPMEGWLAAFASMDLVAWDRAAADLEVLREPTSLQIERARSDDAY